MKKTNRTYQAKITQTSDGSTKVDYALERVQVEGKPRYVRTDKRQFTRSLKKSMAEGSLSCN